MTTPQQLLWRYEAGLISQVHVEPRITSAIEALLTRFRADDAAWKPLARPGRPEAELRKEFDAGIDAAQAALRTGKLRSAWQRTREAERALTRLHGAVQANSAIESAAAVLSAVPDNVVEARENVVTTLQIAKRLLSRAREEQAEGRFDTARYMASLAALQIEQDLSRNSAIASTLGLADTLSALRNLEAGLLERFPDLPPQMTFVAALDMASRLIEQKLVGLAQQLVADIASSADLRAALLRELERQCAHNPEAHPGGLAAALRLQGRAPGESWREALSRVLNAEIRRVAALIPSFDIVPDRDAESTRGFEP